MRFVVLIAGATAVGGLSGVAIQKMFPQTAQTFQAVRALGGDVANFKIGEINPLKAYQDVVQQITSGKPAVVLPPAPTFNMTPISPDALRSPFKIDNNAIRRSIAAGINSQVQQDIRRAQDLAAYTRNPMAWHGAPPH